MTRTTPFSYYAARYATRGRGNDNENRTSAHAPAARAIRCEHKARASVINGANDQIIWAGGSKRRARSFTPSEYALSYDD